MTPCSTDDERLQSGDDAQVNHVAPPSARDERGWRKRKASGGKVQRLELQMDQMRKAVRAKPRVQDRRDTRRSPRRSRARTNRCIASALATQ